MIGCLNKCGRVAKARGLCGSCYNPLAVAVKAGKVTWEKLVEDGKALAAKPNIHWGHGKR